MHDENMRTHSFSVIPQMFQMFQSVVDFYRDLRLARKPTWWTLCKISNWISRSMQRRLTRSDNFRVLWNFCFRNHYSIPISPWDGMCRPGLACADCAGLSGSIHYAEPIMLAFSTKRLIYQRQNGSYMIHAFVYKSLSSNEVTQLVRE